MKLSIIIPAYNSGKFISKCILSITTQKQPSQKVEVLIIDDGSTDDTYNIVREFASKYDYISVQRKKNGGLSSARNYGISLAKGEYLFFLDSDDWISETALVDIFTKIDKEHPDVLVVNAANVQNGIATQRFSYPHKSSLCGAAALCNGLPDCATLSIVRSAFLKQHKLYFCEGIIHEDAEFTPRLHYLSNKISFINKVIYYINIRSGSLSRSTNPNRAFDLIKTVCPNLSNFLKSRVIKSDEHIFHDIISKYINNAYHHIIECSHNDSLLFSKLSMENRHLWKHLKFSKALKYKIEYCLFSLFPNHTVNIYKILSFFRRKQ